MMSGLEEEGDGWEWEHESSRFCLNVRGYDAGYFAYPLGKAYAQDLFKSMFETDPMSREMGMKFRKTVLVPGGNRSVCQYWKIFLGEIQML
jgi:metallopeptidase MepB